MLKYKTAAGRECPPNVWAQYVKNVIDETNARQMIKETLIKNQDNPFAIKELRKILFYRTDLLNYLDRIMILL
jgi:hypothetical protein